MWPELESNQRLEGFSVLKSRLRKLPSIIFNQPIWPNSIEAGGFLTRLSWQSKVIHFN
jgi:hypothetical protein